MIIKARSRTGGRQLARYLLTENERQKAVVLDTRGSATDKLGDMLHAWDIEAKAMTKAVKPLYHMMVRLAPGEAITRAQWFRTLELVEAKLGLSRNARAVVAHDLDGERHIHAVYSRLNDANGKLVNMGHDRRSHHAVARLIEMECSLRKVGREVRPAVLRP